MAVRINKNYWTFTQMGRRPIGWGEWIFSDRKGFEYRFRGEFDDAAKAARQAAREAGLQNGEIIVEP